MICIFIFLDLSFYVLQIFFQAHVTKRCFEARMLFTALFTNVEWTENAIHFIVNIEAFG